MQIAIHLGAHRTDDDPILQVLQRNSGLLHAHDAAVAPPRKARPAIRKAAQNARGAGLLADRQDDLLTEMLGPARPGRVVLSYEAFLGVYARVLEGGRLYADAGQRAQLLRNLFPDHEISFFLAIRNPATFLPEVLSSSSLDRMDELTRGAELGALRWSDPVRDIRAACPDVPLTVWCNEDLPLIFPQVLEAVSGVAEPMEGEDAMLERVMTRAGLARLRSYLRDNPPATRSTWRKVVTAFLGKYADPAVVEPEIDVPGWTAETLAGLSAVYERDVESMAQMPGLTMLRP